WDASGFRRIAMDVVNTDTIPVSVGLRIDNPGGDGSKNCVQVVEKLEPGEKRTIIAALSPTPWVVDPPVKIEGMRAAPGTTAINPANLIQMIIFVPKPEKSHIFTIDNIRAEGRLDKISGEGFFPFIDEFGQYIHSDWPGKLKGAEDFKKRKQAEARELAARPGPPDRNKYGGWTAGPQLKGTGFFRAEKYKGKWWLIDPEGRLFWSHGIDCVTLWLSTGIDGREKYFKDLPDPNGPGKEFYGKGWWAPHGYYKHKIPYKTFSHRNNNLKHKYGADWKGALADITHRRLRSWGHNTIANWSSREIYIKRQTPYVATIHINAPKLEGSQGYWGKFHDVFDPGFREALQKALKGKQKECGDAWCIGFFVDNELAWGDDISLAMAALASPAEQAAKKVFIADLKAGYKDIAKLNQAWGTSHASWEALLQNRKAPDKRKARPDLERFYTRTAETYFKTIKEELKRAAPDQLYLGCRFAWVNDRAARAAIKFCDVISYNKYAYSVADLKLPDQADLPVIIGEFHFGALDRGMFHTGLKKADDQKHRAQLYQSYVQGALRNPLIVGTHWFQYFSQSTTGRGDGENYQIGFVDICDTPYPEIVKAAREVGASMYALRLGER
ncbi:beta-galactosidase, partial [Planctomycetota bacterium]